MDAKQEICVCLSKESKERVEWLKQHGQFKDDTDVVQKAIEALYQRFQGEPAAETTTESFVRQSSLNPDDFE